MTATRTRSSNGSAPSALADGIAYENQIAAEAVEVRGDATTLTPELFFKLLPLLRRPIHSAFIQTLGVVKGKPYESTGIKSVQVQIDRMDNVLTPLWWGDTVEYFENGALCKVTVEVYGPDGATVISRSSYGGVNQASTTGNLYKGSYTNAAKPAFARVGPGHEVYVGATDLDPDVHQKTAEQQAPARTGAIRGADPTTDDRDAETVTADRARKLAEFAEAIGVLDKLQLAASHARGDDVGDCSTVEAATVALGKLNRAEAVRVEAWINRKADEAQA